MYMHKVSLTTSIHHAPLSNLVYDIYGMCRRFFALARTPTRHVHDSSSFRLNSF